MLSDAEVTSLIIDPNPMFVERALGLLEKVPSLKQILTIGPVPEALAGMSAVDLTAEAAKYEPQAAGGRGPTAGSHRRHDVHRRHHRQAQGCHRHHAVDHHHDDRSARRVGVAGDIRGS